MRPIVQISLDVVEIDEALATAAMALRAGVDWLEAGTPLILAEGMHGVRALRARFPDVPLVADLKTMDGGWLEAELMAKAGATHVVVMAQAHDETIRCVVQAGRDFGVEVMGDNLACQDKIAAARRLEDLGCHYVIHHVGYDERRGLAARGEPMPSPLDQLREVVAAVRVPVQAVGGLTIEQAIRTPEYGAPLVVLGAPLTIDADAFRVASGDVEGALRLICEQVHAYGGSDFRFWISDCFPDSSSLAEKVAPVDVSVAFSIAESDSGPSQSKIPHPKSKHLAELLRCA